MNRKRAMLVGIMVLGAVGASPESIEPSRESLLAAWESSQRDDPQTLVFEALGDGRYRYSTEMFPFDGTIRVLNLVIDDRGLEYGAGGVMGVVEVDLEDISDEYRRQYAYSIGLWHSANTLYFDGATGSWLSATDWQSSMVEQYTNGGWFPSVSDSAWLVLLAVMLGLVAWLARRAHRQIESAAAAQRKILDEQERVIRLSEEAVEISRDSNSVLKEIRDALKEK